MNIYILAAAAIAAYVCIWRVVRRVWLRPKRLERQLRAQGLKGNPYRLWHGDMKELDGMTAAVQSKPISLQDDVAAYALPFHHHILTAYGKRSFMWNGPNPRIMIMEPNMIKEIAQKYEVFRKSTTINPLNRLLVTGLVSYQGAKWSKHRQLLNPSFTVAKLKGMVPTMHISCNELVEKLQETVPSDRGRHEVDVWPILAYFTADVISRTAFGSNYKEGQRIFLLQKEQALLVAHSNRSVYVPGYRFLPTKANKRMKEISREVTDVLTGIIRKKMEQMKSADEVAGDLLGILLESNMKEIEENGNKKEMGITTKDVIEECKLFYFAGQETTSNLLAWTVVMLSVHQNWQMEARQEVLEVFGKNTPDFDGLHQLKKINMILHEVLRLYSPLVHMNRTIQESTKLGELTLPDGVEIVVPTLLVHRDKEIWGEDADEFKPERFAQGIGKAATGHIAVFLPFGLGPRICIGMNFALLEAKLAVAMILQRFSFELSPNYRHAPVPMLTLQPKFGTKILLSKV